MVETQSTQRVINSISFNQTHDHLVVGTDKGFQVYSLNPEIALQSQSDVPGGVKLVQILNQGPKQFVALVGTGVN